MRPGVDVGGVQLGQLNEVSLRADVATISGEDDVPFRHRERPDLASLRFSLFRLVVIADREERMENENDEAVSRSIM